MKLTSHRFRPVVLAALTAASFFLLCACGREQPGTEEPGPPGKTLPAAEDETPAVQLREVDLTGLRERLEVHRGQVVLVDVWATWCRPCVASWPKLVDITEKYREKGLAVLTLNTDLPEQREAVEEFLRERGAPGESLLLRVENFDDFVRKVGRQWEGGLPAILLYDRAGNLQHELLGARATAGVEEKIRDLLAEQKQPVR